MKELIIDRSKWRFGGDHDGCDEKYGSTELLNSKGYMCCLGFFSKDLCKVPKKYLKGVPTPECIHYKHKSKVHRFLNKDILKAYTFWDTAIGINDVFRGEKEERELLIINLFKEIGVSVSFINEYPE